MRVVKNLQMRWDMHHHGLWLQLMTPSQLTMGDHFDSGHLIQRANNFNAPPSGPGGSTPLHLLGIQFQRVLQPKNLQIQTPVFRMREYPWLSVIL